MPHRCRWVDTDITYQNYHDQVWGKPEYDSQTLFKYFCLEGQQAGLSWLTILKRQAQYEEAFDQFDPDKIAQYDENKIAELLQNEGIIRNRRKIESIVTNAKAYIALKESGMTFAELVWSFTEGKVLINSVESVNDVPAQTTLSVEASKEFKKHGFRFIGPVSCYAFFQAVGVVNDHENDCDFKWR